MGYSYKSPRIPREQNKNNSQVISSRDLLIPDRWRLLNLWKGHVFTIPKRSPAELPGPPKILTYAKNRRIKTAIYVPTFMA